MKKYVFLIVPVTAVLVCSLFLFTSLDRMVFDLFLRTIPTLTENEKVLLVTVDDPAIENVGLFPWPRDIMADAIVYLREMGAEYVAFDLSYQDNSPARVDQRYVKEEFRSLLDYQFGRIDEELVRIIDTISSRQIAPEEAQSYKARVLGTNNDVKNSIDTSISYVTKDLDAYFAKSLRFFGNSYTTLTLVHPDDISEGEKTFNMSPYDVPLINEKSALKNIVIKNDTKTPEFLGIIPTIPILMRNARGAGFVNSKPDPDGYRRRNHLLAKYDGHYYTNLIMLPLLEKLGNPRVEVTNAAITLKAVKPGTVGRDIRIPRSEDGSVLIKWPKKRFQEYKPQISSWDLIAHNRLETIFVKNLRAMNEAGFFSYWDEADTPFDAYTNADYIKELLLEGKEAEQSVSFETYIQYRNKFFDSIEKFLSGGYEQIILSEIEESNLELRNYVTNFFTTTRDQFADLVKLRERISEKTDGAFCIIGVHASSMTDYGLITFQEHYPNVGIYSTIANMILSEDFLDDSPAFISVLIALALSLSLGIFIRKFRTRRLVLAGLAALVVSVLSLLFFFMATRTYIGVIVPFTSVAATFLSMATINFFETIREKSFLRSAFSRYLSPAVINEIIADPSKLNLGGEKREMTAIFTDVRGFSSISEKLDPADLVKLLNLYLTDMSNIILDNRGTIDKYEGDAIIAFFGAPIPMSDHAPLACRTAIRMKQAEKVLNERIISENLSSAPMFTRIGINTGDMVVGNMGTPNKMDYTIMGHAVNLAARLEGVNKQYGTRGILISEYTRNKTGNEFLLRRLDRVRVVGVNTPLRLYELLKQAADADPRETDLIRRWETAVDLYEGKEFEKACLLFTEIERDDPEDMVVRLYIARCKEFIGAPPPEDWDGVFNLTQK